MSDGSDLQVIRRYYVLVDPRGVFYSLRMAAIKVCDGLIKMFKRNKPFVEFAEFLANYPLW